MEYAALIKFITRVREESGVSGRQLSGQLNQSHDYISTIEDGSRRVDMIEFIVIAEALKLDPGMLFDEYLKEIGRKRG